LARPRFTAGWCGSIRYRLTSASGLPPSSGRSRPHARGRTAALPLDDQTKVFRDRDTGAGQMLAFAAVSVDPARNE
jgi:hypothetical protein